MLVVSSVWRLKYLESPRALVMPLHTSCAITFNIAVALVRPHLNSFAIVGSGNIEANSLAA